MKGELKIVDGEIETLVVDEDGKICIKCLYCKINRRVEAHKNKRIITVRCNRCKREVFFKIDWRKSKRKSYREKIYIRGTQVSILDLSLGGLSFKAGEMDIPVGTEIIIELPVVMIRKDILYQPLIIKIVFKGKSHYGAKFLNLGNESVAKERIGAWLVKT
ncbi:MAG TPA: hypothetical protein DDY52_02455 [Candidatus Moranbacteria bacterium]|nr:MAG: hypothetical protein UR51_C0002G0027 [Candidatus Moranbacteria bacterium GW2011_GWF1_34_10]HBI16992.1 hypothetical protein [Candidatus Moranbacteria bacterium]